MRHLVDRLGLSFLLLFCCLAFGETYPAHPIKLVHPWSAGGVHEVALRLLTQRLADALKQPVIIENKPGAGNLLGTDYVAKSAPDGYTLVSTFNSSIAPGPLMHRQMPYDPLKDFAHIVLLGVYPQFMIVRADSPVRSLQEFIALVKAKPGAINYASAGIGTAGFLAAQRLKQAADLNMMHVPYKGPTPAIADLMGGRLDMVLTASAGELARAGKVRILAVTSGKRVASYPDIPTLDEMVPGVQAVSWIGISAPAKTPRAVITRLETEILAIVSSADVQNRLVDPVIGLIPLPLGSEKFVEFIQNEIRSWAPIIKAGNIVVE